MFEIGFDEDRQLLSLTIEGFWDEATAARFAEEMRLRSASILTRYPAYDVLSDARGFAVQTSGVAERFQALAESGTARRTAIVVSSALAKMQARRTLESERVRIFGDMDAARAWLESG